MAMGGSGGQYYDLLGVWVNLSGVQNPLTNCDTPGIFCKKNEAMLWLVLTFVAWLGVTIHDLALIGQTQKAGERRNVDERS